MNDPKLLIVSASRVPSAEFESSTLLGRSLRRLSYNDLVEVRVATSNTAGLPSVFNAQIIEENRGKILLFVHDDVWLDDYFVYERLLEALEKFDVVGIAGNVRRESGQPAWAFTNEKTFTWDLGNLSGVVGHGDGPGGPMNFYGRPPGQACRVLDGLFIAARCDTLLNADVRFDERFTFDFYDMDFCRSAEAANLRIGTWPIAVTHASVGKFGTAGWHAALVVYREKWGETATRPLDEELTGLLGQGGTLARQRRFEEALACLDRALEIKPDCVAGLTDRGGVLIELRRCDEAVVSLDRALLLEPDNVVALSNRGAALVELKRQAEAVVSLERALVAQPGSPHALFNLGTALRDLKRPEQAAAAYARLLEIAPAYPYAEGFAHHSRLQACDWSNLAESARNLVAGVEAGRRVDSPFSFFAVSESPSAQLRCAQTWAADKFPMEPLPLSPSARGRRDRLRIAYLSADFGEHPVAHSIVELLEAHDKARFALHCVSFGPEVESPTRARIKKTSEVFVDARAMSDLQVAQTLRELEIDLAIDLNGFTQGNRSGVLALRSAPVQAGYLGFSGTAGAPFLDYIIADGVVIPPGQDPHYSERVVRLPDAYLPIDRKRAISERTPSRVLCGLPREGMVFCCFNNSFKIAPLVFDAWMRILKRVDGSVLWLFEDNADAPRNLRLEARKRGVDPDRLIFARRVPLLSEHLARYRLVDLFLDTLPYNAHVTTADALWTGAPVLTCLGTSFVGRVAGSLLRAAGLPELVARDLTDYEDMACRLAAKPRVLADLKARLAANRSTQPLFDTGRLCRHLESAYIRMSERSRRGLPPEAFDVVPGDRQGR